MCFVVDVLVDERGEEVGRGVWKRRSQNKNEIASSRTTWPLTSNPEEQQHLPLLVCLPSVCPFSLVPSPSSSSSTSKVRLPSHSYRNPRQGGNSKNTTSGTPENKQPAVRYFPSLRVFLVRTPREKRRGKVLTLLDEEEIPGSESPLSEHLHTLFSPQQLREEK